MMFYLAATEILVCEISRRNDRAFSCNHDIDLVISIALIFCETLVGLMNSGRAENKHKGFGNKGNILRSG